MCFVTDISEISCVLFCFSLFQAEKVHELNEEIGKLLAKAEQLGAEGNVDEAQKVLQEVEKVRTKKKDAEVSKGCFGGASSLMWWFPHMNDSLSSCFNDTFFLVSSQEEYRNSMPASSFQQQKLRVCEVCSAYLGLHDNDRRLADHFGGKLHLGFIQIREKLDQLKVWAHLSYHVPPMIPLLQQARINSKYFKK